MDDLISRADIEWHDYLVADGNGMYHEEKIAYKSQIDMLPSAQPEVDCQKCIFCGFAGFKEFQTEQPERKKGMWRLMRVKDDGKGNVTFQCVCSKCGHVAYEFNQPYCHYCGAYMRD